MANDLDFVKAAVEGTVSGAIEGAGLKELLQAFLGPFAREAGAGLGYVATGLRIRLGLAVMEKARRMLLDAGFEPSTVAPKLFFPLLQHASLEDDELLQSKWAGLLATSASPTAETVHPSYPGILGQLSSDDAKALDEAIDTIVQKFGSAEVARGSLRPAWLSNHELASYNSIMGSSGTVSWVLESPVKAFQDRHKGIAILDRLVAAGLVRQSDRGASSLGNTIVSRQYWLTEMAFQFVEVCRGPQKKPVNETR